ncbi:hypothetical protein EV363DRAFT_1394616 [Boletus edulis]|nr:hypothetical protein EV363DRAFT_1394616 [Boletus edulis]
MYVTCLDDPWDLLHPVHVELTQRLWDKYVKVPHTRSQIAKKAILAVHCFFTEYEELQTLEGCATYVAWKKFHKKGKGAFHHLCIIRTLAYLFETVAQVPSDRLENRELKGGLALCTVAVERAFKLWRTGELVIPTNKTHRKSAANLSQKQWEKLKGMAKECMHHLTDQCEELICERVGVSTGRTLCFEEDSD